MIGTSEMVLYGKNSVFERLKAAPSTIKKVFMDDSFSDPQIEALIKKISIPFERVSQKRLAKLKHNKDLQGIVARVDKFKYAAFDDLLNQPQSKKPTVIFLDGLTDPHNLGVIIRTAACFGGFAVVIPKFGACEVNETVLHVASGGENYVSISIVTNITHAIIEAKKSGYWVTGAVVTDDAQDINEVSMPFPLCLVLGSEGEGIHQGVRKHLDIKVHIPMEGAKLSFNVNMACALICYEICKRRKRP